MLVDMTRLALLTLALTCTTVIVALTRPAAAAAGWCWPNCSSYGMLGPYTSTYNGCWYSSGEVCSGWSYWSLNGLAKTCYPGCDAWGQTGGEVLYGFENSQRIRGKITIHPGSWYIHPSDVGMGGYLRAQVKHWSGSASQVNVAAAG